MSELLKKALKQGKPPKPEEMMEEDEDDYDEEEEAKDTFETKFPGMHGGPIKPTAFPMPSIPKPNAPTVKAKKNLTDYTPSNWEQYYDSMEYTDNGTPVYKAGEFNPIFFCLHGAGDSALSFACLAKEIRQFASIVSFDFRGHGNSKHQGDKDDLSVETLIKDTQEVLEFVANKYPDPTFIIAGHSMGGSIAAKFAEQAMKTSIAPRIQGLIVIDVVEGTAMDALPFMGQIVSNRPQQFKTLEQVVKWGITSQNVVSARVSMPPKVIETTDENGEKCYEWKVNLMNSEKHWASWFKGLTNSFLEVRIPKLLMTAEKERMDKDLTIAQMQGRFKLSVLFNTGHYMQEDDYFGTAGQFHQFLKYFRVPTSVQDQGSLKELGVGRFNPELRPYNPKK